MTTILELGVPGMATRLVRFEGDDNAHMSTLFLHALAVP